MTQRELFPAGPTLAEARDDLEAGLRDGVQCPCCGQHAQVYRRRLTGAMVRFIRWVSAQTSPGGAYVAMSDAPVIQGRRGGGDGPKARWWGLIESDPARPVSKGGSGAWRITERGRLFVAGAIDVPAWCEVYAGEVREWSSEQVRIGAVERARWDRRSIEAREVA